MFNGIWQWITDNIFDPVLNQFRTQEEINERIDDKLGNYGVVTYDAEELPADSQLRRNVFLSHDDLIAYIRDGAIPSGACTILVLPNWNEDGDNAFALYVSNNSGEE